MVRKRNSFIITEIKDNNNEKAIERSGKKTKTQISNAFNVTINAVKSEDKSPQRVIHKTFVDNNNETKKWKNNTFKTNRFRTQSFNNRRENGLLLLSPKVEQKIYKLKKSLRNKGLDEMEIKDIIRKRRREEENRYYRDSATKCFKCRQSGHKLAECPQNSNDYEEGVDVCYRCGSSEHKLSECNHKSEGLPFVKCFLCSQTGHLTRDCTENKRGIYPKGGECKACHSVNHLIKDCPLNENDKELENEITLTTFDGNHSIDADVMDTTSTVVKTEKMKKVIKF